MKISREIGMGVNIQIELTDYELLQAVKEVRINFYISELEESFSDIPEMNRECIAENANDIYLNKEGYTEYEALEEAVDDYRKLGGEVVG